MVYTAPYIDSGGIHVNTYADIEDYLVSLAQSIFGSDIYLENDSQDFQDIATRAKTIYDEEQSLLIAYQSRAPLTATGNALDALLGFNGITRKGATYSTAPVTLSGTAYTVINNGVISDVNGNEWNLPATVTLDESGTATTTATAVTSGAIVALAGQITTIITPTQGWTSVTNPSSAAVGQAQETDAEVRLRQAISVENPSQALTTGILGGLLAVPDVANAIVYENDTNITQQYIGNGYNPGGFPSNSITCVLNGGEESAIATAIAIRKTPGCYTNGDQSYNYVDIYGVINTIRYYNVVPTTINSVITITALTNYTSAVEDQIIENVVAYLTSLNIGQDVIISQLECAAADVNTGQYPFFSINSVTAAIDANPQLPDDIVITFEQQATADASNVTVQFETVEPNLQFFTYYNSQYLPFFT